MSSRRHHGDCPGPQHQAPTPRPDPGNIAEASLPHMVVQFLHCMIPGTSFHVEHSIMAAPELCSAQPLQPYRAALSDAAPISL